jgi:ankyrin repeat protein
MIEKNLRGELSVYKDRKLEDIELIQAIAQTLNVSTSEEMDALRRALYPAMVCAIAAKGNVEDLVKLRKSGANLSSPDYDMRTPLHIAVSNGNSRVVEYLLSEGLLSLIFER